MFPLFIELRNKRTKGENITINAQEISSLFSISEDSPSYKEGYRTMVWRGQNDIEVRETQAEIQSKVDRELRRMYKVMNGIPR